MTLASNGSKLYKSEVIKKTLAPQWQPFDDLSNLTDLEAKLKIAVYDWDRFSQCFAARGLRHPN